jgi:outer membrane protein assembly factor BamA
VSRSFSFVILLLASLCWSQNKAQLSFKLLSVRVKGLQHLPEDKVVGASGLQLGRTVTEQDFQQAVQKLAETGLFTDVAYKYEYTTAGCNLDFQVIENEKLVPILFDNFVWFSDDQLLSLLRTRVPLFDGKLPLNGALSDQVADALNAILAERKIAGHAEGKQAASLGGPIDAYTYTVKFHPVIVRNMDFPGAAPSDIPALQAAAKPISGQEYLRSSMRPHEKLDLLPVYLSRGYLKAQFSDSQAKIVSDGPRTVVDVSFPVKPGLQYRVADVRWAGFSAFPVDKLQALIHLKAGQPANGVQLDSDLEAVQKLYGTKGYLTAYVKPVPAFDDSGATVAYELNVTEGDQFRMGELSVDGIDPAAADKLIAQWQIKKGDIFDDSYLQRFFQVMYHDIGLSRSYSVVPKQNVDRQSKTVNVALHFVPRK